MCQKKIFTEIYQNHRWSGISVSGRGSDTSATIKLVPKLQTLIRRLGIKSILDIGCGDLNWVSKLDLQGIHYIGMDIVSQLISNNRIKYPNLTFIASDILTCQTLPTVDLILCRDCLVHYSIADIFTILEKIRLSKSTYCLLTSFVTRVYNPAIITGNWFPINLLRSPFDFSKPVKILSEGYKGCGGRYRDKSLLLWRCKDIP